MMIAQSKGGLNVKIPSDLNSVLSSPVNQSFVRPGRVDHSPARPVVVISPKREEIQIFERKNPTPLMDSIQRREEELKNDVLRLLQQK